jgi:SNF2 family DNA or RNA helicase
LDSLEGKSLILTSYAILRQDQALFAEHYYECVILDEAQMIKNPESQVAQCAYGLQAKMKLALTGTPIENRWDDLWSLFYFLMPELLGDRKTFGARVPFLKKKLRPFILRRTKEVVAKDLPEKVEQTVWVDMDEEQRQFYEEWLKKTKKGLTSASKRFEILEAILRLRQICCHPVLVDGSVPVPSAKLERLLLDVDTVVQEGRKALIYSPFVSMLHLVEKELKARGIKYVYLDGSSQDREAVVNRFQEDPGTQLFLISLKAGGVGLNLTAADYVFLFDPWWNNAVESQAIDRAHRFGRKETVIARRYVMATSIEEKIMHLKAHKASLSKGLFDFDQEIADLTMDDLYNLLS